MPTPLEWQHAWQTLGAMPANISMALYDDIIARYNETHRYYHTLQHLTECLAKLTELSDFAKQPAEIEIALWFHDAIYEPTQYDNEQLSAEWAKSAILAAGLSETLAERVYDLIMATQHHVQPNDDDTQILIDVDLAVLGADSERFREYEQQIRQEYAFVPEATFRIKRAEILQRLLTQKTIFNTPLFIQRYEQTARANLNLALEQLCPC
jgi:predicted metal-dependent HD superfamily phosphohydrolase